MTNYTETLSWLSDIYDSGNEVDAKHVDILRGLIQEKINGK